MMKFILTLLIACTSLLPTEAQTLKAQTALQKIQEHLRTEGFQPSLDSDGDIAVKIQGYRYYIHIEDMNDGSLLTYTYALFSSDQPYLKLLEACNTSNRQKNVVKYYVSKNDDGEASYRIGMETYCNSGNEYMSQIKDAIDILPRCVNEFIETYEN